MSLLETLIEEYLSEDDREISVRSIRQDYSRNRVFNALTPMKKITPKGIKIRDRFNGHLMGFVSEVLIYDSSLRYLSKRDHNTLLRLVLGGHLRLIRKDGPLPGEPPQSRRVGANLSNHYQLIAK